MVFKRFLFLDFTENSNIVRKLKTLVRKFEKNKHNFKEQETKNKMIIK